MTSHIGVFPTARLRSAIRREAIQLSRKCALIVIDEDTVNDSEIKAEIDLVKYCVQQLNIPAFLFYLREKFSTGLGSVVSDSSPSEKTSWGLMAQGAINPSILKAAGNKARIFEKYRNSCFGEFGLKSNDFDTLLPELARSRFFAVLRDEDIKTLIVCGRFRASCVKGTAHHGARLGFKVLTASNVVFGSKATNEDWMEHANIEWYASGGE